MARMTGVVSFSLFGDDPDDIYCLGALKNAELYARGVYEPTLELKTRFYVGPLQWEWASENLARIPGTELVLVEESEDQRATLWRYRALWDRFDVYLFRDVDSRPILRERGAVLDWLSENKTFHIMRDHPYHCVPIMAGLWGMKYANVIKYVRSALTRGNIRGAYYQVDQHILRALIWRFVQVDCISHVSGARTFGEPNVRDFPVEGDPAEGFVGEGFYGDGRPRFPNHSRDRVG